MSAFRTAAKRLSRAPAGVRAFSSGARGSARGVNWRVAAGIGLGATALAATVLTSSLRMEERRREPSTRAAGSDAGAPKLIPFSEVQKHNKRSDCWVVINGMVYDVTDFIDLHPGGPDIIVRHAGTDATKLFAPVHPPDAFAQLPEDKHLGPVDVSTLPAPVAAEPTPQEQRIAKARSRMPGTDAMLLLSDFELWAKRVMPDAGWAYYASAADSESTLKHNRLAWERFFFRPRVLRDITEGSLETEVVGTKMAMPVFIAPAAMAKLGHPLGEINLTKGAGNAGIVQGISINASCSLDEIMAARQPGQPVWFQIYLNRDRTASARLLDKVTRAGATAVIFTVDAAWQSKRTRDRRTKASVAPPIADSGAEEQGEAKGKKRGSAGSQGAGVSAAISGYQDPHLVWDDIDFIRKHTNLPIIIKGIQSVEDVALAAEKGVAGVIISNHGGRSCDFAPAPIDILREVREFRPDLFGKVDIMVDGGVRSGADVVKALGLGAKAVGVGRPFLYANATHGQEGVERVCEILNEEITNTLRNIGVTRPQDVKPEMVGPNGPWVGTNRPSYAPAPRPADEP